MGGHIHENTDVFFTSTVATASDIMAIIFFVGYFRKGHEGILGGTSRKKDVCNKYTKII